MKYLFLALSVVAFCRQPTANLPAMGSKPGAQFRYKYYLAVARSGLRLREAPNLNAKKIALIPYRTSGTIAEALPDAVTIDGRKGFWLRVKYENHTGWVFSGYALLSTTPHESDPNFYAPSQVVELTALDPELDLSEWKFTSLRTVHGIEILQGRHGEHAENPGMGNLFFKKDGELLSHHVGGYERVEKVGFPVPNAIVTTWVECTACCAEVQDWGRMYLFDGAHIQALDIQFRDQQAECGAAGEDLESLKPEIINQWSPDEGLLLQRMRYPHCDYYDEKKFLVDSRAERKNFTAIRFSPGKILVEDFEDSDVPQKYRKLWTSGKLQKLKL